LPDSLLLIDDDESFLRLASHVLGNHGYEVTTIINPENAIHEARRLLPAVVLVDVQMPRLTGFEVFEQFRVDPILRHVPFIFLSAKDSVDDRLAGLRVGADDYLTKPIVLPDLLARVTAAIERRRAILEEAQNGPALSGDIEVLGLTEVLQALERSRSTGTLQIESSGLEGKVTLSDGKVFGVKAGQARGIAAMVSLLRGTEGRFAFVPTDPHELVEEMNEGVTGMLLEASRIMDESY
jgi:DNA-binding response OmpR family regulator